MKKQTLASLKKKAWKWLSILIRRFYADSKGYVHCYTCNWSGKWLSSQAGHAIGGRHGAVLFDESIIRPQCYQCNVAKGGNYGVFALRLIQENGQEWYARKQSDSHRAVKYSRIDLLSLIEEYKNRIDKLDGIER